MPSRDCKDAGPVFLSSLQYLSRGERAACRRVDSEEARKVLQMRFRSVRGSLEQVTLLLGTESLLCSSRPPGCLGHTIRHMGGHCAHLLGPSHMEHLVIKEDVWADLLKKGAFGCSG